MEKPNKITTAQEAVALVKSSDTVAIGGIVSMCVGEKVLSALGQRFRETGVPAGLTLYTPNRAGWPAQSPTGLEHFAQPGMVRRLITSTFNGADTPKFVRMCIDGQIEAYSFPMGLLFRLTREIAAQSPGMLTEVGLNTYADPGAQADDAIRVNHEVPPQDIVSRIEIDGKPVLLYRTFPIDVAIIRGSIADTDGNISLNDEPVDAGAKHLAMAAKNSGGVVIAQVKHITQPGMLPPRSVAVPGMLVDKIVLDPTAMQSQIGDNPAWTGHIRVPTPPVPPLPFDHQKVILRRAAREIEKGAIINLGVGIPTKLPALALEEGFLDDVTFSIEHGAIGGMPAAGVPGQTGAFGAHFNPSAILDSPDIFDFYHGGGLNMTCLGFAEVDELGNVNVGAFGGKIRGPGGFLDIVHRTKRIILCGTLTAGNLQIHVSPHTANGKANVRIMQEGANKKLIKSVEQVNLHAPTAAGKGQIVKLITERAVFDIRADGLYLTEIAPGIDIDRDIRPAVELSFKIASNLVEMDEYLFRL